MIDCASYLLMNLNSDILSRSGFVFQYPLPVDKVAVSTVEFYGPHELHGCASESS